MLQFYFLSILLNMITGLILLFAEKESQDLAVPGNIPAIAYDETFRLVVGLLTCVTGFFKLLSAIRGDVPVIGDLVPAVAGLAGGFVLLYEFYRGKSAAADGGLPSFLRFIVDSRRNVGIGCVIAACLHFLFPSVLLL